jgi:hypothetical protein
MGMARWWECERMIAKVCHWDGMVPERALDGFEMPAGKWADDAKQGWQAEFYLVAPNVQGNTHGLAQSFRFPARAARYATAIARMDTSSLR